MPVTLNTGLLPTAGALFGAITQTGGSPNIVHIPAQGNASGDFIITLSSVYGRVANVHIDYDSPAPGAAEVDITVTDVNTGRASSTTNVADGGVFVPESASGTKDFFVNGPVKLTLDDLGAGGRVYANITVVNQ